MDAVETVITGIGIVSALGFGKDENWANLCAGRSGVQRLSGIDMEAFPAKIGSQVADDRLREYLQRNFPRALVKRSARFSHLALAASRMAIEDAGLDLERDDPERIGVVVGTGGAGLSMIDAEIAAAVRRRRARGLPIDATSWWADELDPLSVVRVMGNCCAAQVSIFFGLQGPSFTVGTACASGATAVIAARDLIRLRRADVVLAGGTDALVSQFPLLGFSKLDTLSRRNDAPEQASRPFDRERDGFVMGEGAAMLVLETATSAHRREARAYARLLSGAATSEAHNITAPESDGRGMARVITMALREAGVAPEQVGYVSAHGTSTLLNDACETRAIKQAFGAHARKLWISSQKSMLGHTIGAAGAIETAVTALTIEKGVVTPTINLDHHDPECDLDYVANTARERHIGFAVSNSFGFGGHDTAIVLGSHG
jgi:3-oxoacyl-[acyl-carrier-protein] synthase II